MPKASSLAMGIRAWLPAWPCLYRRELTIIVLEQDGQHFTAVQLVGIEGHLGL